MLILGLATFLFELTLALLLLPLAFAFFSLLGFFLLLKLCLFFALALLLLELAFCFLLWGLEPGLQSFCGRMLELALSSRLLLALRVLEQRLGHLGLL